MSDTLTNRRSRVETFGSEGPSSTSLGPTLAGEITRLEELIDAIDKCVADALVLVERVTGDVPLRTATATGLNGPGALLVLGGHLTNGEEMLGELHRALRTLRDAVGP